LAPLTTVFKLAMRAERHRRKRDSLQLLVHVIRGVVFTDGVTKQTA
jgi:hypothetical protein